MAGKRFRASDGTGRPKANTKKETPSYKKKQTSLLSFWGVRTKSKTPNAKSDSTPSLKVEPKNNESSMNTANNNDRKYQIIGKESNTIQTNCCDEKKENLCQDDNLENSTQETFTEEQSSVAITPCKVPLEIENYTKGNDDDNKTEEPIVDQVNNPVSPPAPIHSDCDENESTRDGLSEYEKLRLRNIERNNARLAALGLLTTPTVTNSAKSRERNRPPRKRPKIHARKTPQQPLRRSSRNRNPPNPETEVDGSIAISTERIEEIGGEQEEEQYTVSPLLEYEMSQTDKKDIDSTCVVDSSNNDVEDASPSASLCLGASGPRFIPPKGLNAIYSLEFWRNNNETKSHWMVGAGKAGMIALWDTKKTEEDFVDPILSWKAHSGRWIADAKFLLTSTTQQTPSRLLTSGNDGTVCLWDLSTVSSATGAPKLLQRTDKSYHSSGIFCMAVSNANICTGSKDKSIAVSSLESLQPFWRSHFHTSKVGDVSFKGEDSTILASASDDGLVGIHDTRAPEIVAHVNAHDRPHSVTWGKDSTFVTAGLDPIVKIWDQRNLSEPLSMVQGHVPTSTSKFKRIHRPVFYGNEFLLTGGQGSSSVSVYNLSNSTLCSRGKLPEDCGDSGCIAVNGKQVAVTVDQGEILLLEPTRSQ